MEEHSLMDERGSTDADRPDAVGTEFAGTRPAGSEPDTAWEDGSGVISAGLDSDRDTAPNLPGAGGAEPPD